MLLQFHLENPDYPPLKNRPDLDIIFKKRGRARILIQKMHRIRMLPIDNFSQQNFDYYVAFYLYMKLRTVLWIRNDQVRGPDPTFLVVPNPDPSL